MPGVSDIVAQRHRGRDRHRHVALSDGRRTSSRGRASARGTTRAPASAAPRASPRAPPWLKTTLVTAAWAAVRKKDSYLRAQFLRLKARRGAKKAIIAVAASMLTAIYYMLRDGVEYRDLGADHFTRHDKTQDHNRLVRRLRDLGCEVDVNHAA